MLIGNRLRLARAEAGKTLRQTEEDTGLSKDTISRIERGTREPQPLTVAKLAKAYGRTAEEFLEGPKERRSSPEAPDALEGERLLEKLCRRLISELEEDAKRWESTGRAGEISHTGYQEVASRRLSVQDSLNTLGDVSETLNVDFSDRRGHPLRHVRRELQSAYNRWSAARMELIEKYFNSLVGTQLEEVRARHEEEEERIDGGVVVWLDVG